MFNPAYYRPDGPQSIPFADPASAKFLDALGRNRPQVGFALIPGTLNAPGWFYYGDEKSGGISDGVARLGFVLFGQKRHVLADAGIEFWDKDGVMWGLANPGDYVATVVGSHVSAGSPVCVPSGFLTVPSVALAQQGGNQAIGMAVTAGDDGDVVQVRTGGVLELKDWSLISGSPTLSGDTYYLSVAGTLTADFGGQQICNRIGPTTVRVNCAPAAQAEPGAWKTNAEAFSIQAGMAVALSGSTDCVLAIATSYPATCFGLALVTAGTAFLVPVHLQGPLRLSDWTDATGAADLAPGEEYFLSASSAGVLTIVAPGVTGNLLQYVGLALDERTLSVNIERPYTL